MVLEKPEYYTRSTSKIREALGHYYAGHVFVKVNTTRESTIMAKDRTRVFLCQKKSFDAGSDISHSPLSRLGKDWVLAVPRFE